jgi:hypothetical protein
MKMNLNLSVMKSNIFTGTLLGATVLFLSVLTCYGQNDPSDQVVGKWTKELNERTFTFNLTSDNKYQVEFAGDDEIDVYGSYKVSGKQITFTDEGGDYSSNSSGVYEFKVSDTSISFTNVDDPVNGRSMLVEGTWSKATDD